MTRRPTPAELVAGPRGARLCLDLALLIDPRIHGADGRQVLSGEYGDPVELLRTVDPSSVAEQTDPLAFVWQVADTVVYAKYWQQPDDIDQGLAAMPETRDALLPVAAALLSAPATAWWSDALDLEVQSSLRWEWRGSPRSAPALTGVSERLASWTPRHPGGWWAGPLEAGPTRTTRAVGHLGCAELMWAEECGGDFQAAELRALRSTREPRVYEIDGAAAWAELVQRFPCVPLRPDWPLVTGRHDCTWWIPDWRAVADVYDAVHLTVTGYLTTATRALDLDRLRIGAGTHPAATLLGGWNPDETLWLSDVLQPDGAAQRWVEDYGRPDVDSLASTTGWHPVAPPTG